MRASLLLSCLAASVSIACSDGYPTSDEPARWGTYPPPPEEVIAVLNDLGRQAEAVPRWTYRFTEPCTLTVARERDVVSVDLRGHWVHTRTGSGDAPHALALEPLQGSRSAEVLVYASTRWRSVLEAASAIKQLSGSCPR
jgi:hypothetical protein